MFGQADDPVEVLLVEDDPGDALMVGKCLRPGRPEQPLPRDTRRPASPAISPPDWRVHRRAQAQG